MPRSNSSAMVRPRPVLPRCGRPSRPLSAQAQYSLRDQTGDAVTPQQVISVNPFLPLFGRFQGEYERRFRDNVSVAIAGSYTSFDDDYTNIDAKLRRTQNGVNEGNQAVGVPEYLLNANVEWDVPFIPALTVTGRVVHTGQQAANITNTLFLEEWTRFDLGLRYVAVVAGKPLTFGGQCW
jgi:hypothetical protein